MKPYSEQIAAIKDIIDYTFDPDDANEPDIEALRDAASTIIAVERDEKLFLAAGDLLEALTTLVGTMKNNGINTHHWKKHLETAQKAINKATQ